MDQNKVRTTQKTQQLAISKLEKDLESILIHYLKKVEDSSIRIVTQQSLIKMLSEVGVFKELQNIPQKSERSKSPVQHHDN